MMYPFFYSNISEFYVNLKCMLNEGRYKTYIQNMHKIGQNKNHFKSDDVSMMGHGCGVSQFPRFYKKNINCYHVHM